MTTEIRVNERVKHADSDLGCRVIDIAASGECLVRWDNWAHTQPGTQPARSPGMA